MRRRERARLDAAATWTTYDGRPTKQDDSRYPVWAIVPSM